MAPQPDKTGGTPSEDELAKWQRAGPIMNEVLQGKGLVNVAEDHVHVTGLKGPLEDGWKAHVAEFATRLHHLTADPTPVDDAHRPALDDVQRPARPGRSSTCRASMKHA